MLSIIPGNFDQKSVSVPSDKTTQDHIASRAFFVSFCFIVSMHMYHKRLCLKRDSETPLVVIHFDWLDQSDRNLAFHLAFHSIPTSLHVCKEFRKGIKDGIYLEYCSVIWSPYNIKSIPLGLPRLIRKIISFHFPRVFPLVTPLALCGLPVYKCSPKGYGFLAVWVINRVSILAIVSVLKMKQHQ